jgi:Zn-finger nucleic acid-binding protein
MKCPACDHPLSTRHLNGVALDVCDGGCGGLWLDAFELGRLDEAHEADDEQLLRHHINPEVAPSQERRRACPRCPSIKLRRHFFSAQREVEVDSCPQCGGLWLDHGELHKIRAEKIASSKSPEKGAESLAELIRQRRLNQTGDQTAP